MEQARKIIGNDVIVLFLAYNIAHLDWVKTYKNALFSNDPNFYEEYLKCFSENEQYGFSDDIGRSSDFLKLTITFPQCPQGQNSGFF